RLKDPMHRTAALDARIPILQKIPERVIQSERSTPSGEPPAPVDEVAIRRQSTVTERSIPIWKNDREKTKGASFQSRPEKPLRLKRRSSVASAPSRLRNRRHRPPSIHTPPPSIPP